MDSKIILIALHLRLNVLHVINRRGSANVRHSIQNECMNGLSLNIQEHADALEL
jgi:hypothetical protein